MDSSQNSFLSGLKGRFYNRYQLHAEYYAVMGYSQNRFLRHLKSWFHNGWKISHKMMISLLHPLGEFDLDRWNKLFVLSCAISLALDPLFFYIPMLKLNDQETCLDSDRTLAIVVSVLRSVTDAFYAIHIFQFKTGIFRPSFRVHGWSGLFSDPMAVDILAILPLPQVVVFVISPSFKNAAPMVMIEMLKSVIFCQYVPRLLRIYPLYVEVIRSSGRLTNTTWGGAAYNFFLYMLASHVVGACWYFFGIDRQDACWQKMCRKINGCQYKDFYCGNKLDQADFVGLVSQACRIVQPDGTKNSIDHFDYGIFTTVLKSGVVESTNFLVKFSYCFWWGFRSLSSIGQSLETSTFFWEIVFVVFIAISGLVLFLLLIGNMQKYLQSTTMRRVEEMTVRKTDAEEWMSRRKLPDNLRERVRQYEQYKWLETRGVNEENLIHNLPKDLRRDIKRHLCLALLKRVPIFNKLDEQLWDPLLDRLKPVLYTPKTYLVREGDPVDEMLFIMQGTLTTSTTNGYFTGYLRCGDFCGEELLTWALSSLSPTVFPISTRTVEAKTEVDAFVLMAKDLRTMASQFPKLDSKELQQTTKELLQTTKFFSRQWRTWAACFIQSAWRRYSKKNHGRALSDVENRLQFALANEVGTSASLGAAIYASRFAAHLLRAVRRPKGGRTTTRVLQLLPPKPAEPDFSAEGDNTTQTSIGHPPKMVNIVRTEIGAALADQHPVGMVNIVRTEIRAALAEHRVGLLEDMGKFNMLVMTRLADMEGRMTAIEEVVRTRGL